MSIGCGGVEQHRPGVESLGVATQGGGGGLGRLVAVAEGPMGEGEAQIHALGSETGEMVVVDADAFKTIQRLGPTFQLEIHPAL